MLFFFIHFQAGSSGVRQLLPLIEVFGKDRMPFYKYLSVLQCISAVIFAIQESPKHNWDEILGIEKVNKMPFFC
jgi:hypothetical protein